MFFKNAQLYRLPQHWDMTAVALNTQLERLQFQPCGSQDTQTSGWVTPCAHATTNLVHNVGGHWLICQQLENRLLPTAVIKQTCEERAKEIAKVQEFPVGRSQMKEIKESVIQELLPKAFTRRKTVFAWIDPKAGFLVINASSHAVAEKIIEDLHKALDELPLKLVNTELTASKAMTDWVSASEAPVGFTIDEDCELRAIDDESSAVRYVNHSLEGDEIRSQIAAGKTVCKLGLTFDDRLSFILSDRAEIKRINFYGLVDKNEEANTPTKEEQFDADFALMTGELARFIPSLMRAFGGEVKTI